MPGLAMCGAAAGCTRSSFQSRLHVLQIACTNLASAEQQDNGNRTLSQQGEWTAGSEDGRPAGQTVQDGRDNEHNAAGAASARQQAKRNVGKEGQQDEQSAG